MLSSYAFGLCKRSVRRQGPKETKRNEYCPGQKKLSGVEGLMHVWGSKLPTGAPDYTYVVLICDCKTVQ